MFVGSKLHFSKQFAPLIHLGFRGFFYLFRGLRRDLLCFTSSFNLLFARCFLMKIIYAIFFSFFLSGMVHAQYDGGTDSEGNKICNTNPFDACDSQKGDSFCSTATLLSFVNGVREYQCWVMPSEHQFCNLDYFGTQAGVITQTCTCPSGTTKDPVTEVCMPPCEPGSLSPSCAVSCQGVCGGVGGTVGFGMTCPGVPVGGCSPRDTDGDGDPDTSDPDDDNDNDPDVTDPDDDGDGIPDNKDKDWAAANPNATGPAPGGGDPGGGSPATDPSSSGSSGYLPDDAVCWGIGASTCDFEGHITSCKNGYTLFSVGSSKSCIPEFQAQEQSGWDGQETSCVAAGGAYIGNSSSAICDFPNQNFQADNNDNDNDGIPDKDDIDDDNDGDPDTTDPTPNGGSPGDGSVTIIGPGEEGEGGSAAQASGGSGCQSKPNCSGDPIQCAILQQIYEDKCALTQSVSAGQLGVSDSLDDITLDPIDLDSELSGVFSDNGSSSSCPSPVTVSLSGSNPQFSFQMFCDVMSGLRPMVLLIFSFISFRIVMESF